MIYYHYLVFVFAIIRNVDDNNKKVEKIYKGGGGGFGGKIGSESGGERVRICMEWSEGMGGDQERVQGFFSPPFSQPVGRTGLVLIGTKRLCVLTSERIGFLVE